MGLTKHLPTIGRVFTPAAMLVFLTYEIVGSQTVSAGWRGWVLLGAALTAVGVEVVGIMAGHTFEGYWRTGDKVRTAVSFALLIIYMVAGLWILWGNPSLLPIPVIATVVYLVAALAQSLEIEQAKAETADVTRMSFDLEQEALDRENQRLLDIKRAEADSAAKIERIRAKSAAQAAKSAAQTAVAVPQAANSTKFYECSCGEVFDKPQSYSAHRRHCDVGSGTAEKVSLNGANHDH